VVKNMGKPAAAMCTRDAHSVRVCGHDGESSTSPGSPHVLASNPRRTQTTNPPRGETSVVDGAVDGVPSTHTRRG
jgi:hypothetical protein